MLVARVLVMLGHVRVNHIGGCHSNVVNCFERCGFCGGRTDDQHQEERCRDKPRQATRPPRQRESFISGHRLEPDAMSMINNISTAALTLLDIGQPPLRTTVSGGALAGISPLRNNLTGGQET